MASQEPSSEEICDSQAEARSASASPASSSARAAFLSPVFSRHLPRWNRARARPKYRSAWAAAGALPYISMTSRSRAIEPSVFPADSDASATRVSTSMRRTS
ncbi:MAG TPA: hypothetical protein VF060_24120 [Trebonia sp.]